MKTKLKGFLTLLLALVVQITFAQEKTVSGTVSESSGPLPGVSVLVKGTTRGVETDFDGKYSIKVNTGDVLVFRYLGYTTVERTAGNSNTIDVTLKEGGEVLDEIVVTALGNKRNKRSLGYAQQGVDSEELVSAKQADIANAIAGKISGVQILAAPKSGFNQSQIRLRGNRNVLYVVDGIRLQNSDDVNPEDVSSMSVLKGAAATALYGPEGSNGVVIITSQKAKNGDSSISYDGALEIGNAAYIHDLQNEYGGGYSQTFSKFSYDDTRDPTSWASFDGDNIVDYFADESWGPKLDGRLVRQWDSWIL
ncbi:carboxypeptidase-like regulatory domain-containing protein [Polaribacter sp. HL-MS24]|uniref:carboxypeptidase-like regulatory domain-containing protein n=1 Tax=Polaribacter sp. HL-MS24 TaxID=3077735 RepID=UPI0029350666|nr:carboxypeptidase-like regulatory domain-containing protein [Polaribacter sp. HL-MS24]WOC40771.1 carboxypeptidase-like regulatory domain-containing protein [Polaribacter sp. HL-MS24]